MEFAFHVVFEFYPPWADDGRIATTGCKPVCIIKQPKNDFGAGYKYVVILEDAKVTVE